MVDIEEGGRQFAEDTAEAVALYVAMLAAPRAVVAGKGGSAVQASARLAVILTCLDSSYLLYVEQAQGAFHWEGKRTR